MDIFVVPILATSHVLAASMSFALQDIKISGPQTIPDHELHQAVDIPPEK